MRVASAALALAVSLGMVGIMLAEEGKCQKDKAQAAWTPPLPVLKGLDLSPEQKAQLDTLKKEYQPKLSEAKLLESILTPEQKAKLAEAKKQMGPIYREYREKIMAVLTPEQQEQVKKRLEKKGACAKGKAQPACARPLAFLKGLNLSADQKAQIDALKKQYQPKLNEGKLLESILTPEQKKARREAAQAAKAAGKSRKEIQQAAAAAVTLTPEQKAKLAEAKKQLGPIYRELREKIIDVLTPEQQEQVKK
jgi:Spy/CpxP family protein refolding chaperone